MLSVIKTIDKISFDIPIIFLCLFHFNDAARYSSSSRSRSSTPTYELDGVSVSSKASAWFTVTGYSKLKYSTIDEKDRKYFHHADGARNNTMTNEKNVCEYKLDSTMISQSETLEFMKNSTSFYVYFACNAPCECELNCCKAPWWAAVIGVLGMIGFCICCCGCACFGKKKGWHQRNGQNRFGRNNNNVMMMNPGYGVQPGYGGYAGQGYGHGHHGHMGHPPPPPGFGHDPYHQQGHPNNAYQNEPQEVQTSEFNPNA